MATDENLDEIVNLRNTVSGVAMEVTLRQAKEILAHPVFGPVNEIVRTNKHEVLRDRSGDNAPAVEDKSGEEKK